MVEGPGAVAPGPEGYGLHHPPATDRGGEPVSRDPREPPEETGARGSHLRDRRPPSFRWDCGNTRIFHRGDQTMCPFPSPLITTYLQLPRTASPSRNPGIPPVPPRGAVTHTAAEPSRDPGTAVHITCSGSSFSAALTRLPSLSTPRTIPELPPKIYSRSRRFSVARESSLERAIFCRNRTTRSAQNRHLLGDAPTCHH